jgi:hypothetical protein
METIERRPRPGRGAGLVAAGVLGGVVLAGFATSYAQTPSPSTPDDGGPAAPAGPGGGHGGPGGHRGGKHGFGVGIHGEFVTPDPDGSGYQTIATQAGEVTAVSATSITVRSEDGFSRTYAVDDNTLVNAGDEGIADVANGDDVRVTALVVDGKASAVRINDKTNVEKLNGRWLPRRGSQDGGTPPAEGSAAG